MDPREGTGWQLFPTDVLVEILKHLPPNTRRRFRIVCRRWRKLVDKRSFLHRSKTLIVTDQGSAFVMDDQTGQRKELWTSSTPPGCRGMRVVGTCNGLVCLCDDGVPGGAITVANPVTGEMLDLPPLPLPPPCEDADRDECHRWHQAYSFGYLPATKRYEVVHAPCRFDEDWEFHTVQVFPLGEATWRDVEITVPDSRCNLDAGIVDVDGTTYWTTAAGNILSFDHENDIVTPIDFEIPGRKFLTVVDGMLGIASRSMLSMTDITEVQLIKRVGGKHRSLGRQYILQVSPPRNLTGQRARGHQHLTRPHFVQDSGHVLTWGSTRGYGGLYKHKLNSYRINELRGGSVEINEKNQGTMVADIESCSDTWAFKYVQTNEPLRAYRLW